MGIFLFALDRTILEIQVELFSNHTKPYLSIFFPFLIISDTGCPKKTEL